MSKVSMEQTKEKDLIEKSKKNKEYFAEIYAHYKDAIYNYTLHKVSEHEIAQDITQDVFKKALEGLESFKWQGVSFSAWLYRIAKNKIIDFYRAKKSDVSINDTEYESKTKGPSEIAEDMDFEYQIGVLLKTLPERESQIIYMKFFEGYTNKTIAQLTNLSETNVGTILYRSLEKLRQKIL